MSPSHVIFKSGEWKRLIANLCAMELAIQWTLQIFQEPSSGKRGYLLLLGRFIILELASNS